MRKDVFRKGMVLGVIILFVGAGILPNVIAQGTIPPTVEIIYPEEDTWVSGTIIIQGTSQFYNGTVELVQVKMDNHEWENASGTTSWNYEWNTTKFANGNHTIYARSFDGENYSTNDSVTVGVDNTPPECWFVKPREGMFYWRDKERFKIGTITLVIGFFKGITIQINAHDDLSGVEKHSVKVTLNNYEQTAMFNPTTGLYEYRFIDTVLRPWNPVHLKARATDEAGNTKQCGELDIFYLNWAL